jgi:phosphoribosyl 1,2-cyclic phosphodiesterase
MSMTLCVLGSGSAGNCSLLTVQTDDGPRHLLIDAGLSPRQTALRLGRIGRTLDEIRAILITHPDTDHLHPNMLKVAAASEIPLYLHSTHTRYVPLSAARPPLRTFVRKVRNNLSLSIDAVMLAHDDHGTVGYVIESRADSASGSGNAAVRLGFATDLGMVPERLFETFEGLDMLAIESNYDRAMQLASGRPMFLKRRIMGGQGHLSNDQSLEAVQRIAEQSHLQHIALLHLSRDCNDPSLICDLYDRCARDLLPQVTITSQIEPTPMLGLSQANGCGHLAAKATAPSASQLSLY